MVSTYCLIQGSRKAFYSISTIVNTDIRNTAYSMALSILLCRVRCHSGESWPSLLKYSELVGEVPEQCNLHASIQCVLWYVHMDCLHSGHVSFPCIPKLSYCASSLASFPRVDVPRMPPYGRPPRAGFQYHGFNSESIVISVAG